MRKSRSKMSPLREDLFAPKKRKPVPHEFVLDALAAVSPRTNPMFGCLAVYVADKIVFALRDKPTAPADNGVWLATTVEHHESLRADFPSLRSIGVLGKEVTGWQILPADSPDFEEAALRACELVMARDPRIGKVPKPKRAKAGGAMDNGKNGRSKREPSKDQKAEQKKISNKKSRNEKTRQKKNRQKKKK